MEQEEVEESIPNSVIAKFRAFAGLRDIVGIPSCTNIERELGGPLSKLACGVIWLHDIFHTEPASGVAIDQVELVLARFLQPFLASRQLKEEGASVTPRFFEAGLENTIVFI